jgi:hypothetical protein
MIPEPIGSFDRSLAFMRELVADLSDDEIFLQPPGQLSGWRRAIGRPPVGVFV